MSRNIRESYDPRSRDDGGGRHAASLGRNHRDVVVHGSDGASRSSRSWNPSDRSVPSINPYMNDVNDSDPRDYPHRLSDNGRHRSRRLHRADRSRSRSPNDDKTNVVGHSKPPPSVAAAESTSAAASLAMNQANNNNNNNNKEELESARRARMARLRADNEDEEKELSALDHPDQQSQAGTKMTPIKDNRILKKRSGGKDDGSSNDSDSDSLDEDEQQQEALQAAMLGFTGGFGSTKGQKVADNYTTAARGAAAKHKARKYRQYMNRKNGFNRPLDKMD